jgi:hypothetical protein
MLTCAIRLRGLCWRTFGQNAAGLGKHVSSARGKGCGTDENVPRDDPSLLHFATDGTSLLGVWMSADPETGSFYAQGADTSSREYAQSVMNRYADAPWAEAVEQLSQSSPYVAWWRIGVVPEPGEGPAAVFARTLAVSAAAELAHLTAPQRPTTAREGATDRQVSDAARKEFAPAAGVLAVGRWVACGRSSSNRQE